MNIILATDCGSTTSKARFFKKIGDEYRFVVSGEAPTTVESPFEDVTLGVRNAVREVEELTGHKLLGSQGIITPSKGNEGADLYVTTSSAGGGLQMMVAGVVKTMTAESAERAALGAGAIVMDVIAVDDGRRPYEKIERIRYLRPDMILMAGGTDGGTITHVAETAELIEAAKPRPRLGADFELPIVFAGNKKARTNIKEILDETFALKIVENLRPVLEMENTEPARNVIHELFMEHVMSHAPGYDRLMKWTPIPIMPTPAGEGKMFQVIAEKYKINVVGVGLGGATTNVYSIYENEFVRTVSANLGMSYSICNVLKEAGTQKITRWIPFDITEDDLRNRLYNKMIRPTTVPQSIGDLVIEHAVAREALRLGFAHHKLLARPLRGVQRRRTIADIFDQRSFEETYIDMLKINLVAGTGGLLSHAPRRAQSALMLIDGFQPEGVTRLAQDSVFMMPHLGVLSTVHPEAAMEIFEKDCLIRIGVCIAPKGTASKVGEAMEIVVHKSDNSVIEERAEFGTMKRVQLEEGEKAKVEITPFRGGDVGKGEGKTRTVEIEGGTVGIILDARGRPVILPDDKNERRKKLVGWFQALDAYPEKLYELCGGSLA
ncbi:MAG: glutamate mutase L [Candidatus Bathyarchaeota archaeon]|nr:MAG: glutamate mutase L [Candidatus Bathyarchaeota archaeon]